MSKAARNVIKTMVTVSIVFVLCWLANATYFIYYTAGADIKLSGTAYSVTVYAVFGNAIVNAFIYSVQYVPFQNQVKKLFCINRSDGDRADTVDTVSSSLWFWSPAVSPNLNFMNIGSSGTCSMISRSLKMSFHEAWIIAEEKLISIVWII